MQVGITTDVIIVKIALLYVIALKRHALYGTWQLTIREMNSYILIDDKIDIQCNCR